MNSEKIKTYLKDYRITLPLGVIVGIILGLVIGWGLWPVQWTDLAPYHLRPDLREDYLRMAIFTTTMTDNPEIADKAWSELEDTADETLAAVEADPRFLTPEQIASFGVMVGAETAPGGPTLELTPQTEEEEEPRGGPNWLLLAGLCVVLLLGAAVVIYFFFIRTRLSGEDQPQVLKSRGAGDLPEDDSGQVYFDEDAGRGSLSAERVEVPYSDEPAMPVAQFMTTYMMGDDLYDDSFSIDAPTGEFLGECGVGISDTVGVGEPKRVSAFEVWLFDKNDIQTVTKVIMSEHAYEDNKIRMRLESKGEPILVEPGKQVLLETATLQLQARIVDMEYGEGAAPDQSYFQRLTLELAVWPKERVHF